MTKQPDWTAIVAIALETDRALGEYTKPGQRVRALYADTHRKACDLGYGGSELQWRQFIRQRAKVVHRKKLEKVCITG